MAERGVEITGELSTALTWVLGPRYPAPTEVDVLAAYLDLIAKGFGLSSRAPDVSRTERERPPAAAVAMLRAFVGDTPGSDPIDEQVLGDQLYDVLADLAQEGHVGKLLDRRKPLTAEEIRQLGQIYWNLEGTDTRPLLPIRSTKEIGIKVPRASADFATMVWANRLKSGLPGWRENSFRIKGARLAVLAAQRILQTRALVPIDVEHAHFKYGDSSSVEKRISAIYWSAGASDDPRWDPDINALRRARRDSATAADAADICISILAILERRSAASPGDREAQLAEEYLQAGLSSVMAGRVDEAIDRFLNAQRVTETLSELAPDDATQKLGLAVALTMLGLLHVQLGQAEDAEKALLRAAVISQDLTDSDPDNEDLLAIALSMLGVHYLQVDRTRDAETALRRSATISERLSTRNPDDYEKQLQFANTLTALGGVYMQAEKDAEDVLVRAVAVSQNLAAQRADEVSRILLSNALLLLGTHYLSIDREQDGEDALTRSLGVSQELVKDASEGMTHPHQPSKATDILAGALFMLGFVYQFSEREQEAENAFNRVLTLYQDQLEDHSDTSLLGRTLDALNELYRMQGRNEELEKSLLLRQRMIGQGGDEPAGF